MTLIELAAIGAAFLMVVVVAFQVALAAGLPLGEGTMGGRAATVAGVLEQPYRLMALASAAILVVAAWLVLGRAGLLTSFLSGQALVWSVWVVAGFMVLNTLTNLSGKHPLERWGMGSIPLGGALLVGYVGVRGAVERTRAQPSLLTIPAMVSSTLFCTLPARVSDLLYRATRSCICVTSFPWFVRMMFSRRRSACILRSARLSIVGARGAAGIGRVSLRAKSNWLSVRGASPPIWRSYGLRKVRSRA